MFFLLHNYINISQIISGHEYFNRKSEPAANTYLGFSHSFKNTFYFNWRVEKENRSHAKQMATGNFMKRPKMGISFGMKTEYSADSSVLWSSLRTFPSSGSVMCYAYPSEHRMSIFCIIAVRFEKKSFRDVVMIMMLKRFVSCQNRFG